MLSYRIAELFRLGDLRPSDVQSFANDLVAGGLSLSRIRQVRVVLGLILDAAMRDGMVARNVARGVKLPKASRREAAYFEPDVVDSIVAALQAPHSLLVRVLGVLGLRFGEAAALERCSVDLLRRRLHVRQSVTEVRGHLAWGPPKSHQERQIPLTPSLADALEDYLECQVDRDPNALLFTSARGDVLRLSKFDRAVWRPVLKRLGLPPVGVHVCGTPRPPG